MLRRLWNNFKKDWLRGQRHFYLLITILTTLIYFAFIRFVLPADYAVPAIYQYSEVDLQTEQSEEITEVASEAELMAALDDDANSYGLIIRKVDGKLDLTIITQSASDEKYANMVKMLINNEFYYEYFGEELFVDYPVEVMYPEMATVDYRTNFIPIMIVMDSAMVGMFLLSVMLFIEKDQKMHTAYMVSPGRLTEHLLSKTLVMIVLSLASAFTLTLLLRGFEANYLYLLIMMLAGGFFGASLGVFLGSIFKNVMKSFGGLVTIMMVMAIPVITYAYPSFDPWFNKFIPTYHMLFGLRAAILPVYGFEVVWKSAGIVFLYGIVIYTLSQYLYRKALYRNG